MGRITIEIPQKLNRNYHIDSENFLPQLENLVEENKGSENHSDLNFSNQSDENLRATRMDWLKANRENYAGKYVALDGNHLVGIGETIREAHTQAKQKGVKKPFLVRVSGENEILSGGW